MWREAPIIIMKYQYFLYKYIMKAIYGLIFHGNLSLPFSPSEDRQADGTSSLVVKLLAMTPLVLDS